MKELLKHLIDSEYGMPAAVAIAGFMLMAVVALASRLHVEVTIRHEPAPAKIQEK